MNHRSISEVTALSACALAAALLLAPLAASAQPDAAKPKAVTTVTVPDAPATIKTAEPAATEATTAGAEQAQMAEPEEEDEYVPPLQVGDATLNLLAWQRSGEIASPTPRPIAGNVASRSYERYLKSFEFPIPERLNSTVSGGKSGGSSSGGSR
ncbi:DUF3613 domain-containing protein [Variovorax sp.]|jgi:hypothetical protein|uniref:DUF3613 domain-containing protein n=1 Tax=Variovorax sp. TaxID=1871043 RepID=UPI0037DA6B94